MLCKRVLTGLVLRRDTDDGKESVERNFLQLLNWGIRISHIHKLVEIKKRDKLFSKQISLESHLGHRITIGELRDEQACLSSYLQRGLLAEQLQANLVNLDV